ncbi:MAG: hypothetical protein LBH42_04545 [Treponema sp.]|nr:hypothetical protein [Treponema sp.]
MLISLAEKPEILGRHFVFLGEILFLAVIFLMNPVLVQAESPAEIDHLQDVGLDPAIGTSTDLEFQFSSRLEARICLIQRFIFPFLAGTDPHTRSNNITAILTLDMTPVSLAGIGEIIWTLRLFST